MLLFLFIFSRMFAPSENARAAELLCLRLSLMLEPHLSESVLADA